MMVDLHNDVITNVSPRRFSRYIKTAEKVGVETILISVWTTEMQDPLAQIQRYRQFLDGIQSRVKLLLHIEDAWFIDERNIDEVIKCKPYSVGLTWNTNNDLAGGAKGDGNLTPLGLSVIEKLIANGIVIDLAHLNRKSFWQVADLLKTHNTALLCTHTCFDEVHTHPRNLDRAQIQTIVDSGGLVGLTLVGDFLTPNKRAVMHDVYKHIAYFIDNFGYSNLAIGTDFFGTDNLPKGLRCYKDFKRLAKILRINKYDFSKIAWRNWEAFNS